MSALIDEDGGEQVDRAIDQHVSRLRAKLEANPNEPRHLLTVRGVGYRFEW
jgi:two-component system response regulator RegX3